MLFLFCSFICQSCYYSLSTDIARGPCYATLLMTILMIRATDDAVREINMLLHVHMMVKLQKEKGTKVLMTC